MLNAVSTGVTSVIGWVGEVITALTATNGSWKELLPLFGIGIAVSAVLLGVKAIRSVTWGA